MRIYTISRSLRGIVSCTVRQEPRGEEGPRRLPHANLHSPRGFECGYAGSGPADLAASILADFFNVSARTVGAVYRGKPSRKLRPAAAGKVVKLHQDFKAEVIAGLLIGPGGSLELTGDEIAAWLTKHDEAEAEKAAGA